MASGPRPLSRKKKPPPPPPTERAAIDEDRSSRSSSSDSFPLSGRSETANGDGDGGGLHGYRKLDGRVRISLNSCSKVNIRELKRRLMSELDEVRCLVKKLEASKDFHGGAHSQFSSNYVENPPMRVNSEVGSVGPPRADSLQRGLKAKDGKMKTKKMMMKKKNDVEMRLGQGKDKYSSQLFKNCSNLLDKLMKHKFGWVFNAPVDVKALGLHDYFTIVKHPMDLGTVKSRLSKAWYKSAMEFAEDVRLTFRNAMLYNPKGQDVHSMAEQLLKMFEEKWGGIEVEYNLKRCEMDEGDDDADQEEEEAGLELARPAMRNVHDTVVPATRTLERAESMTKLVDPKLAAVLDSVGHGVRTSTTTPVSKKPRAKDPDKREMTYEEKQRLSNSLQNLPSEKLDNVVQIIKKRNPGLFQQEDEIEVDIASVDLETLWELDRFVTNYKKSLSKNKRKAELALQSRAADSGHGIEKKKIASSEAPKRSKSDSDSDGLSGNGSDSRDSR